MTLNIAPVLNAAVNSPNRYLQILDTAWQQHLAPRSENAPTVISTFAGAGGSSLGYSMAGYRELLAVEWDNNAVETFKLNFPDVPVYHGDIAKLSVDQCLAMAGIQAGELDVLDGSPPCQGFSTAGKRVLDDPRNQLFREYVRLLRGLQPKVFVMENVSGMVKGKMKLVFVEILKELKVSGYQVSARLLNAMYFNVPQSRQRMIFIGVRNDLGVVPSHPVAESRPLSIKDALGVNGFIKYRHNYSVGKVKYAISDFNNPCLTITKTGLGWEIVINSEKRRFNKNELSVLASYPSQFKFIDNESAWERIGNSVPPLFMRSIAAHVRDRILRPNGQ